MPLGLSVVLLATSGMGAPDSCSNDQIPDPFSTLIQYQHPQKEAQVWELRVPLEAGTLAALEIFKNKGGRAALLGAAGAIRRQSIVDVVMQGLQAAENKVDGATVEHCQKAMVVAGDSNSKKFAIHLRTKELQSEKKKNSDDEHSPALIDESEDTFTDTLKQINEEVDELKRKTFELCAKEKMSAGLYQCQGVPVEGDTVVQTKCWPKGNVNCDTLVLVDSDDAAIDEIVEAQLVQLAKKLGPQAQFVLPPHLSHLEVTKTGWWRFAVMVASR